MATNEFFCVIKMVVGIENTKMLIFVQILSPTMTIVIRTERNSLEL